MKIKIGVSACMIGQDCNFNGKSLLSEFIKNLAVVAPLEFIKFCPEDSVFGTPRENLRIVGGDGYDVLDGKAHVITESGKNVTHQQITGAQKFLSVLQEAKVNHAILMEGSPSCGSNVILKEENWPRGGFKKGVGVACTLLRKNGITILGGFDERSICDFVKSIDSSFSAEGNHLNLKEMPKFKVLFEA